MKKLKDMSDCEVATIVRALGDNVTVVEFYALRSEQWVRLRYDNLKPSLCYRLAPTKPSVNWDHIGFEFNHIARDSNKTWWVHKTDPTIDDNDYWADGNTPMSFRPELFASFKPGNCNWKDSKISRGDK